jgi:hypothetical protein
MLEFINQIAKENPEVAVGLFLLAGMFWLIRSNFTTISNQHREALAVSNRSTDAHMKNTEVLSELKTIIQTLNK